MGAWDQGEYASAPRMADMAKRLATPFTSEGLMISTMRAGAGIALHELEMECIQLVGKGRRSISIVDLSKRCQRIRAALDALTPTEGK